MLPDRLTKLFFLRSLDNLRLWGRLSAGVPSPTAGAFGIAPGAADAEDDGASSAGVGKSGGDDTEADDSGQLRRESLRSGEAAAPGSNPPNLTPSPAFLLVWD